VCPSGELSKALSRASHEVQQAVSLLLVVLIYDEVVRLLRQQANSLLYVPTRGRSLPQALRVYSGLEDLKY
jgi:hypothetical protein